MIPFRNSGLDPRYRGTLRYITVDQARSRRRRRRGGARDRVKDQ